MLFIIRFTFYFTISFIILSFPLREKSIFYHIDRIVAPYTIQIYSYLKSKAHEGKRTATKFFTNSGPRIDKIKIQQSSKVKKAAEEAALSDDSYTLEEKEMLRKIITNSHF